MKIITHLRDNAMLFKDITQWLRRRTFLVLFIGLLLLANLLSIFIMSLPLDPGQSGLITFALLGGLLFFYMEIIALMTHGLTASEFSNGTFELFELSGMTLERMIRGKLFSAFAEFFFGFFAIIPYMFFAYLQGGIDFYLIFALILLLFLLAPALFSLALMVAVLSRVKSITRLLKIAASIGIFFLSWGALFEIAEILDDRLSRTLTGGPMVELIKQLMLPNSDAWWGTLAFLFFYLQLFLFVFYVSCNAISPPSDTRQTQVKALVTLLAGSWVGLYLWLFHHFGAAGEEVYYLVCIVVLIVTGIMGLAIFYGTGRVPAMAQNRLIKSGPIRKAFHFWFAPNSAGTFRSFLLTWLFVLIFMLWVRTIATSSGSPQKWDLRDLYCAGSMALQLPFFLGFPAILFMINAKLRAAPYRQRMLVFSWWLILGLGVMITLLVSSEGLSNYNLLTPRIFDALALFVSPVSSCFAGAGSASPLFTDAPTIRMVLGGIGLFLMWSYLFVQRQHLNEWTLSLNAESEQDAASQLNPVNEKPVAMDDKEDKDETSVQAMASVD